MTVEINSSFKHLFMKRLNLNLILLLFIILGITSCQEEEISEEPDFISADVNGEYWKGEPWTNKKTDSIWLSGLNEVQNWSYILGFKIKFKGEGDYTLNKSTGYTTLYQKDQESERYSLDESLPSQFTITEYDTKRNIIRGNFEMSLLLVKRSDFPEPPEELVFKNGEFKITLDE